MQSNLTRGLSISCSGVEYDSCEAKNVLIAQFLLLMVMKGAI
jgi:hypothetical protein